MSEQLAREWRTLGQDFQDASRQYSGHAIRLLYREARPRDPEDFVDHYPGGFNLYYVRESESGEGGEEIIDPVAWENPAAEATLRVLVTRGLLLGGQRPTEFLWEQWAELLVDTLEFHQENLQASQYERPSYLRSRALHFVDESVMVCRHKELELLPAEPMQPKPYADLRARGLKGLIKRSGKGQKHLAKALSCDVSKVSKIVNCHQDIDEEEIKILMREFKWTREAILGEPTPDTR